MITGQKNRDRLRRQVEMRGDIFPPACACGCGEPVRIGLKGYQKYLNVAHQQWAFDPSASVRANTGIADGIPIEDFRAAVRKLKAQKGWSFDEMARLGGQQPGWMHTYMYDKRLKNIGRATATDFLRRLTGLGSSATPYERRTVPKQITRTTAAISHIGVDAPKPKIDLGYWAVS